MKKSIYLEGVRGVGKSYISRKLRDLTVETILVEHTGLKSDDKEGIQKYYRTVLPALKEVQDVVHVIHDRSPISEIVYSLKKSYSYTDSELEEYFKLMRNSTVYLIKSDTSKVMSEGRKGKAKLFGKIEDSVEESNTMEEMYDELLSFKNVNNWMYLYNVELIEVSLDYGDKTEEFIQKLVEDLN